MPFHQSRSGTNPPHRWIAAVVGLLAIVGLWGCGGGGGGGSGGVIPGGIIRGSIAGFDRSASWTGEVWIVEQPALRGRIASDGTYILTDIPIDLDGTLVSNVFVTTGDGAGVWWARKEHVRAGAAESPVSLIAEAGTKALILEVRTETGAPVLDGTLTFWGLTLRTDANGRVRVPALPASVEELGVQLQAPGRQTRELEITLPGLTLPAVCGCALLPAGKANRFPVVTVETAVATVTPGMTVPVTVRVADPDPEDAELEPVWAATAGTIQPGGSRLTRHWTAPAEPGMATLTVRVTDHEQVVGEVRIGWAVGGSTAVLPRLASFTPASGLPGTWVTLSGTGFVSRSGSAPVVQFNGTAAALREWSESSIVAMVPETAETGPISVVTADGTSTGGSFSILDYQISLSPTFGPPETVITLTGSGFGNTPAGQVLVNGHAATVTSWSDRTIRAIVPRLATTGPVTAVIRGRTHAVDTFTVSRVTAITPTRSLRGATITLAGAGFGEDQGDSTLTVASGVTVVPDSWSGTAITFTVPPEAVSGPVEVRIGGRGIRSPTLSVEYANRYDLAGQWSGPRGTAFPETPGVAVATDGAVFLADRGNRVIWKFAANGAVEKRIGTYGQAPGQIGDPWGLCIDLQGSLWMSDRENHRLQKTDRNGNLKLVTGQFGVNPGQFDTPSGLAVDGAGNIWVADAQNDRIQQFAADGGFLLSIGTSGSGDGQFNFPSGVAIGPTGDIFVADTDNNRVQRLDGSGAPIGWWGRDNLGGTGWHAAGSGLEGRSGSQLWEFDGPMSLCFDATGRLIVADAGNNRLQVLPLGPGAAAQIATGGAQAGQLLAPTGVAASGTTVWVADMENSRAQLFGTDGSFKAERRPDLDALTTSADRLAVDDERGLVYVSDRAEGLINVFTTSGGFVRRVGSPGTGPGQLQQPAGLKVAPDGSLWVVDSGNARIQHFDGDGALLGSFGGFGTGNGQFREPAGLALLANGDLAIADAGNDRIQILATDGTWKRSVGRSGHLNGELDTPQGVGLDRAGNLYVADTLNGRVQKFGPTGAFLGWWGLDTAGGVGWHGPDTSIAAALGQSPCQFLGPSDIAVDPEGSVFVVDATAGTAQKFSPEHVTADDAGYLHTIDLGANLRGIAAGSDGVVYITADDQVVRSMNPSLR